MHEMAFQVEVRAGNLRAVAGIAVHLNGVTVVQDTPANISPVRADLADRRVCRVARLGAYRLQQIDGGLLLTEGTHSVISGHVVPMFRPLRTGITPMRDGTGM